APVRRRRPALRPLSSPGLEGVVEQLVEGVRVAVRDHPTPVLRGEPGLEHHEADDHEDHHADHPGQPETHYAPPAVVSPVSPVPGGSVERARSARAARAAWNITSSGAVCPVHSWNEAAPWCTS